MSSCHTCGVFVSGHCCPKTLLEGEDLVSGFALEVIQFIVKPGYNELVYLLCLH